MQIFAHDVFVSYARANNHDGWVARFVERFRNSLTERLTKEKARIYFDDESVERNEEYDAAIEKALKDSEILLVVGSNRYLSRAWCTFERKTFLQHGHKSRVVIIRYDNVSTESLHNVLPKHLGIEFCDSEGLRFELDSSDFKSALHKLCRDVAQKLSDEAFGGPLVVSANSELHKREISFDQINALIGRLRRQEGETSRTAIVIANSILRGSIVGDRPRFEEEDPIAAVVHGLVRDMVAHDPSHATPAIVRFAVLLHELAPTDSQTRSNVREWFNQVCSPAGYDFETVLGALPSVPDASQRYFWLDLFWDEPIPGEGTSTALGYLRCGHLKYLLVRDNSDSGRRSQLEEIAGPSLVAPRPGLSMNHISVAVRFEELHMDWECRAETNRERPELLEVPMTLRLSDNISGRVCQIAINQSHIVPFDDLDAFSIHVQTTGVFATGKLGHACDCPCDVIRVLLKHATIGLWTRGVPESDENEVQIQKVLMNLRIDEIPRIIHQRRTGAVSRDSVWRRTVLFFDPNVPSLLANADDDILATNTQLA